MMNMMNRFVEGRGHEREIDMLLELTYVNSFVVLRFNHVCLYVFTIFQLQETS